MLYFKYSKLPSSNLVSFSPKQKIVSTRKSARVISANRFQSLNEIIQGERFRAHCPWISTGFQPLSLHLNFDVLSPFKLPTSMNPQDDRLSSSQDCETPLKDHKARRRLSPTQPSRFNQQER